MDHFPQSLSPPSPGKEERGEPLVRNGDQESAHTKGNTPQTRDLHGFETLE